MGCTPPKANMSPENNHDFNRKYIWINHWFSGDTRQFSGENKWLGSPAMWKGIPLSPILRGTKTPINHGFTQSVRFPVGSEACQKPGFETGTLAIFNPWHLTPKKGSKKKTPISWKDEGSWVGGKQLWVNAGLIWKHLGKTTVTLHPKNTIHGTIVYIYLWHPKMKVWKMIFLFKQVIFRFHVNFPGCTIVVDVYGKLVGKYIYIYINQSQGWKKGSVFLIFRNWHVQHVHSQKFRGVLCEKGPWFGIHTGQIKLRWPSRRLGDG